MTGNARLARRGLHVASPGDFAGLYVLNAYFLAIPESAV